jgi:AraC family transcriptional regulator
MATPEAVADRGSHLRGGNFYGSIQHRCQGSGAIFTDLHHDCAKKLPSHSHELPFFCLMLEGDYGEQYGRQEKQFRPFTFIFRPAGVPHQDEVGPRGVRLFGIEICRTWQDGVQAVSGKLDVAHDDSHGGELFSIGLKLFLETRDKAVDTLFTESLVAELVGAAARMRPTSRQAPAWLRRVLLKLRAEYCEHLSMDGLSREAGVHPVHVSRVFRRCVGVGIGEYVHRLRIRAACEQMLQRETTLAEIGLATGFADQSHFTRAFRRYTGVTPAAFRNRLIPRMMMPLEMAAD